MTNKFLRYWIPLITYCVLIFALSSFSRPLPPVVSLFSDKLLHAAEYFMLGFLAARAVFSLDIKYSGTIIFLIAFTFSMLYGVSDEIHQSFVPGRIGDIADFIADTIGAFLGALVYWKTVWRRRAGSPKAWIQ